MTEAVDPISNAAVFGHPSDEMAPMASSLVSEAWAARMEERTDRLMAEFANLRQDLRDVQGRLWYVAAGTFVGPLLAFLAARLFG